MPAHVLVPATTTRGVINMTALAAVEAQTATRVSRRSG
jgi:phosphotransacetylase